MRRRDPELSGAPGEDVEHGRTVIALVAAVILCWFLSLVPFFVVGRYRVPIVPFLIVPAACGIYWTARHLLDRRHCVTGVLLVAWLVLAAWAGRPAPLANDELAKWHADLGTALRPGAGSCRRRARA